MPTVKDNTDFWNGYAWPKGGDEWSAPWGSVDRQWQMTVYPRIAKALEGRLYILEIGPGMGRWTERLMKYAASLDVVDVSQKALDGLNDRVLRHLIHEERCHISAHLGSGTNLPVSTGMKNFVFSFDSLVHADQDTLDAYLMECSRVLDPVRGVGFIHHANKESSKHWRGKASADGVRAGLAKAGLHCYVQELSTWVHEQDLGLTDCFTFFGKADRGGPKIVTTDVLVEANSAKRLAALYDFKEVLL